MPRSSRRCDVCKARKLRCQMTSAGCSNCLRSGIQCPGLPNENRKWNPRFKSSVKEEEPHKRDKVRIGGGRSESSLVRNSSPSSAAPMRAQALSRFFDTYLPDKASCSGFSHMTFLSTLPYRDETNPALRSAIEAVSVAQIGAEYNDQTLMRNASSLYRHALTQLNLKLSQASKVPDEDTLAASLLLQICEFSPGAGGDATGYVIHTWGQVRMLAAIGPERIKSSPFLFELFLSVRNTDFTIGVLEHRSITFGRPEWLQLTSTSALIDPWVALTDIFSEMPALQEGLAGCTSHLEDMLQHRATAHLLIRLEGTLARYFRQFTPQLAPYGPWLVSYAHLKYIRDIKPPSTFQQVYQFSNFRIALLFVLFWGLRWDLLRARQRLESVLDDITSSPLDVLHFQTSTLNCGFQLARSSAFLCQPRFGCAGRIASLIGLKYASAVFLEEAGDYCEEEAQWCSALGQHIKENSLCQPKIWDIPV